MTDTGSILSKEEIKRLLSDQSSQTRIEVTTRIAALHQEKKFSMKELAIAEQFMRILVRDTELLVRENLALRLSDNPNVPRDIIQLLANDTESVALPVIEKSPVLSDAELISLVSVCSDIDRLKAVASRKPLSKEVSAKLIETKQEPVITHLVTNHTADIPYEKYYDLLKYYSKNKPMMEAVAKRPNLPVTIVEKIISIVSESVAEQLRTRYSMKTSKIAAETEKTREVATLKLVGAEEDKEEVEKLVEQLLSFHRLTPSIILTSLCRGNLYFFETSLARLSHIPTHNAQVLIHDKGGNGFKALYHKADLPEKFFAACRILLEVVSELKLQKCNPESTGYSHILATSLLNKTAGKDIENLSYIIALIRQSA